MIRYPTIYSTQIWRQTEMKSLYTKHRFLFRIASVLTVVLLVYLTLVVVDAIQKEVRKSNYTQEITVKPYTGEFKSYDVEGLTDEEISEVVEEGRGE